MPHDIGKHTLAVVFLLASLLSSQSLAATWSVNPDGSADHTTIQAAIDAAGDGDVIEVAAGHYVEQLLIDGRDGLQIVGAGVGTTFIDSPDVLDTGVTIGGDLHRPVVIVLNSADIDFSDLTLDGRDRGDANYQFHGFGYIDAGGGLTDVHITGVRDATLSAAPHGNGIFTVVLGGTARQFKLTDVTVDDFQKTGILLDGPALTVTAARVSVVGQGATSSIIQNGWQVSGGAQINGVDCQASAITFVGGGYTATGLVATTGTTLDLDGFDADACQTSFYLEECSFELAGGAVTNPTGDGLLGWSYGAKGAQADDVPPRLPAVPVTIESDRLLTRAPLSVTLTGTTFTGNDQVDSWGVAVLCGDQANLTMDGVQISRFDWGFVTHEVVGVITGSARNSAFFDNLTYGGWSTTTVEYDALYNQWGDPTGPFHPLKNPTGLGNEVTDNILFGPFDGAGTLVITPTLNGPVACGTPITLTVSYVAGPSTPDLFLYNIEVRGGTGLGTPVSPASLNPWGGTELFEHYDNGDGSYTVTGSTIGGEPRPLTGPGTYDLFTIEVSATADGGGAVSLEDVVFRDPANATFSATVNVATILADCIAPAAAADIVAAPGDRQVEVSWSHDGDDVAVFKVYRALWYDGDPATSAYPEYDDLATAETPTRPASASAAEASPEWTLADDVTVGTLTLVDEVDAPRGVYYYEVFPVDAVGNSAPAAVAADRATNYWLGDVAGTVGAVGNPDITVLGASFGRFDGDVGYNPFVDVGPTYTGSRLGIPTTDNAIDFEDLMIFALNWGVVSPSAKSGAPISPMAQLAWVEAGEGRYALRLVDGVGIKGVRVRASVPVGSVVAGDLLDRQDELTFLRNIGTTLDVSVAVMGVGQGFEGTGDLLVVESTEAIVAGDLRLDVRGHDNSEVQVALDQTVGSVVPRAFELHANYPNPFNPMTKISFSLPQSQPVKLAVYAVDGTLVRTLMNEAREAGLHEVLWNGRNDDGRLMSSGTYFCRIEAGPYSQVRKMSLMK